MDLRTTKQYADRYRDRNRQWPLSVWLALTHDAHADPARHRSWDRCRRDVQRPQLGGAILYTGLDSLSFPHTCRPLCGGVVIAFVTSGTALCVTALVLAWRAVGRKLRRVPRRVVPAAAAIAAFVGPGTATAQTTLADVKSVQCTFTRQTTGSWTKGGAPETAVRPSSLVLRFESIDAETGTAQLRNGAMTTDVIVRLTEGYLHLMQAFRTGPALYDDGLRGGRQRSGLPGGAFPPRTLHDAAARRNLEP